MPRVFSTILALFFVVIAIPAHAQTPGAVPPLGVQGSGSSARGEAMAGFGLYGEDYFLTLGIGTVISVDKIMIGIQVPLKIRAIDNAPEQDEWYREEDWDEPSDWTRIMRFFQYGKKRDPFYLRAGELAAASIGHGTIVHRYYNTLELDHYHTGLSTKVNLDAGGAEFMTSDVLKWNMVAVRGYARPFFIALEDPNPLLDRLVVGTTFASDFLAPWEITMEDATGGQVPKIDSENNVLFDSRAAWFAGIDVALEVLRTPEIAITPYMDLNTHRFSSAGYHLGVLTDFALLDSEAELRLEYRLISARYGPAYFNTLYDLEKLSYLPLDPSVSKAHAPKLRYLEEAEGLEARHGFYGELYANVLGLLGVGGAYEDYQGPDNASVMLRADLPAIAGFKLTGYYARRNFDGLDELFSLDEAYLVAEGRMQMTGPLFLYGLYSVYWQLADDIEPGDEAAYETTDTFQFGVGAAFTF